MSEAIIAAAISVGGMFGVALVAAISQTVLTRLIIRSEHEKLVKQIEGEADSRRKDRKTERILEAASELIAKADPEINRPVDYPATIRLVHKLQILMDLENPLERGLNQTLNLLALSAGAYVDSKQVRGSDTELTLRSELLGVISETTEAVNRVVR